MANEAFGRITLRTNVPFNNSNHEEYPVMVSFKKQLYYFAQMIGSALILKGLSLLCIFSPRCGNWFKRVFFITALCQDMQRKHIFSDMSIEQVNQTLLKLKQPDTLRTITPLIPLANIDWTTLSNYGLTPEIIHNKTELTSDELVVISELIANQVPRSLNYGKRAIQNDITRLFTQKK